jgi:DNA integrity scanning protein DisA with diadenylate cyclase activity
MRQAHIAEWTTRKDTRLALSLNRLGEILIFRQEEILFARRSGRWHFLTHAPVIAQMNVPRDIQLRTAIYETCLDASFARTGACIGVVSRENAGEWRDLVVQEADHLAKNSSAKARALNAVIRGKAFEKLDRRTRQELAAIDGAIVLSHTGGIHAVGAILKIEGGSTGGGRLAAAKALGRLGLGVKVSQDGGITGFRGRKTNPVFRVMS